MAEPRSAPQSPPLGAGSRRIKGNNEKYLRGRRIPALLGGVLQRKSTCRRPRTICAGLLIGLLGAGCASWPVAPDKVAREARAAAECMAPQARALGVPPPVPREPYPSAVIEPDGWASGRGFILCSEPIQKKTKRRVRCSGRYDARDNRIVLADADDKVLRHELVHWLLFANYGFGDGLHEIRAYWENCARGTTGWTWNDALGP